MAMARLIPCLPSPAQKLNTKRYVLVFMVTNTSTQINLRLPAKLQSATEQYVENYGYRNIQELILDAIRDKIFRENIFDETFSRKDIELIETLLEVSIEKGKIKNHHDVMKALE
jgi:hypothetical protein